MCRIGITDAGFDRGGVERTERGLDNPRLFGIGDMSIVAGRMGMLAYMPEPIANGVAFEASELSCKDDFDRPTPARSKPEAAGSLRGL